MKNWSSPADLSKRMLFIPAAPLLNGLAVSWKAYPTSPGKPFDLPTGSCVRSVGAN